MSKKEKLRKKAENNPKGLKFGEFEKLMGLYGWEKDHTSGSHAVWYSPKGAFLTVQSKKSEAKGYQVKQFLGLLEKEEREEESNKKNNEEENE